MVAAKVVDANVDCQKLMKEVETIKYVMHVVYNVQYCAILT